MIQYSRVTKITLAFKNWETHVETKTNVPKNGIKGLSTYSYLLKTLNTLSACHLCLVG